MTSLQELVARRSELRAELARVEEAIKNFADASPVRIGTHKNIRNTWGLTTDPSRAGEDLVVFADQAFSITADSADHGGYVVRSAWAEFKRTHPDMVPGAVWEE